MRVFLFYAIAIVILGAGIYHNAQGVTNPYPRTGAETDHSLLVDKHEPAINDLYSRLTPTTSIVSAPTFTGQFSITGGHAYIATGVTGTTNWKQIDN